MPDRIIHYDALLWVYRQEPGRLGLIGGSGQVERGIGAGIGEREAAFDATA